MKTRYQKLLLPLGVAVLGFIAGAFTSPSRSGPDKSDGEREAAGAAQHNVMPHGASEDDPLAAILGALGESDYLKQLATLGPWLDRLSTPQMHEFLERLRHLPAEERIRLLPAVVAHWAANDPVAATEWIRPYLRDPSRIKGVNFSSRFPDFGACLVSWAQAAPQHALEVARENPDLDLSDSIAQNAVGAMNAPHAERLRLLTSFPQSRQRQWLTLRLLSSWAKEDQGAALAAARALPPGWQRDESIVEVLRGMVSRDPAAALTEAEASGSPPLSVFRGLLAHAAFHDPAVALNWLEKRDPELQESLTKVLLVGWGEREPVAALSWAWDRGLKASGSGAQFIEWEHLRNAFVQNTDGTIAWLKQLPAGAERDQFIETMVRVAPEAASALPLLSQLSGEAAVEAARSIGLRLINGDPVQAEQWASSLPPGPTRAAAWEGIGKGRLEPLPIPPGPDRDAMLSGLVLRAALGNKPLKVSEWVSGITDPALRRRAFDDVMSIWVERPSSDNVQAAREWIQDAPVPAEWKKTWLERLRP